jgi:hypothetical protein
VKRCSARTCDSTTPVPPKTHHLLEVTCYSCLVVALDNKSACQMPDLCTEHVLS